MTHKATIVFADGSKELAHNLDDLRERWILRKQQESEVDHVVFDRLSIPDYSLITDKLEALELRDKISARIYEIKAELTEIKARCRGAHITSFVALTAHKESLWAEKCYLHAAKLYLRQLTKGMPREGLYRSSRKVVEEYGKDSICLAAWGLLMDMRKQYNIQFTQEQWDIANRLQAICTTDGYLLNSK